MAGQTPLGLACEKYMPFLIMLAKLLIAYCDFTDKPAAVH